MEYISTVALLAVIVFLFLQIKNQQKIISDLTERLVARNHGEYLSTKTIGEPVEELKTRKPLSYYDDPNVPDVEDDR